MAIISYDVAQNMLGDATTGPKLKRRPQGRATPRGPQLYCSYQPVSLMHQGGAKPPSGQGSCIRALPSLHRGGAPASGRGHPFVKARLLHQGGVIHQGGPLCVGGARPWMLLLLRYVSKGTNKHSNLLIS